MYYEVYIDQLFLENTLILMLLLRLCGKLMNIAVSWKRIWLSSVSGAAALCAVIFFRPNTWIARGMGMVLPLLLTVTVGLKCTRLRDMIQGTLLLLGATALFAGVFQMIFSIWEPPVLLAAALACTVIDILIGRQRQSMVLGECRTEITLEDQGDRWELTGLIDTGNHLTEPLTGRPVSILEWQAAVKLQRFRRIQEEQNGYLYIPYHSIDTERGWLMGMVIDAMWINYQGKKIRISRPVLAVSREKLSPQDQYQMIIHPLHLSRQQNNTKSRALCEANDRGARGSK